MAFLRNSKIYSERMPPGIIVNLSYGDDPAVMAPRARDFLPTKTNEAPAAQPTAWPRWKKNLIPSSDRTCRTNSRDRGLLGHSHGGVFAIYTIEQRPEFFQRIVAARPTLDWGDDPLIRAAPERLKRFAAKVRLDLATGTENDNAVSVTAFAEALDQIGPPRLLSGRSLLDLSARNRNQGELKNQPGRSGEPNRQGQRMGRGLEKESCYSTPTSIGWMRVRGNRLVCRVQTLHMSIEVRVERRA